MSKFFAARQDEAVQNNRNSAQRALTNYIKQLKLHYDLEEDETAKIMDEVLSRIKNNFQPKKWWQIWK